MKLKVNDSEFYDYETESQWLKVLQLSTWKSRTRNSIDMKLKVKDSEFYDYETESQGLGVL